MARARMLRAAPLLCLAALTALWAPGTARGDAAGPAPDPTYLPELVAAAREMHLARDHYWHVLLHYVPGHLGGVVSEVDGADFFLAPDGKTNPEAELEATLAAFFNEDAAGGDGLTTRCRFVARFAWLDGRLHFDKARLPPRDCPRFDAWEAALRPKAVALVFPAAYMNSPPSMFGHTLFRLDTPDRPDLIDYALNYAAEVPEDAGPLYAAKGLLGFYPGRFSLLPYYAKVQAYAEYENRDLWEYELNLPPKAIDRMLMHAWELGPTYFDYFFLKENCSYHLLSLLEAADPTLDLRSRFKVWTVPTDTLRAVVAVPGLVSDIRFRPSRGTLIRHQQAALGPGLSAKARGIAAGRLAPDAPELLALAPETRARVLDLGHDYLLYRQAERDTPDPVLAARGHAVLVARSRVDVPAEPVNVPRPAVAPHEGHGTQRLEVAGGTWAGAPFVEVDYRTAYHDLLDPLPGYDPDGQLQVFSLAARAYPSQGRLELSRATILDILSLAPWDGFFHEHSWKVRVEYRARATGECVGCGAVNANYGAGISGALGHRVRQVYYLFADADANYGRGYSHRHAVGPGAVAGAAVDLKKAGRLRLEAGYSRYVLGDAFGERRFLVAHRIGIGHRTAVGLRVTGVDAPGFEAVEARGEVHVYW